jgi:hypothetical protein
MSGLIWAGIGQGIANAGRAVGDYMMRSELEEERQREKAELQRERLAATERENQRNRELRAEMAAPRQGSGGSDGGLPAKSIAEGGEDEGMLARRAGMTVPELRGLRKYSETGDTEPFKRDITRYGRLQDDTAGPNDEYSDAVSRRGAMLVEETIKDLPPGFEREARAKMQTLAKIEESYRLGGKYDDVTKGRRNQQEVDMSEAALGQPAAAGMIGQAMAAGAGKDLVGGDSNVTRNKFTGQTSTTPVGESVISENRAQAGQAAAAGRLSGAKADAVKSGEDPEVINAQTADLQRKIGSAKARLARELGVAENEINATLRSLSNNKSQDAQARLEKAKPFIDRLDQAQAAMDEWQPGKAKAKPGSGSDAAPKPAPAPASGAARAPASPASGVTRGGSRWTLQTP